MFRKLLTHIQNVVNISRKILAKEFFECFSRVLSLVEDYLISRTATAHKMKVSIKDFFSKCDQIRSLLRIWSHLLKKSLMENFVFSAVSPKWLFHSPD